MKKQWFTWAEQASDVRGYLHRWWCSFCEEGFSDLDWVETERQTYWSPGDGYNACPRCHSDKDLHEDYLEIYKYKGRRRWFRLA